MLKKWINRILLLIGIIALAFMAKSIQRPFWEKQEYIETIINFQKDNDLLPYRLRAIWWNKSIIFTSVVERTIGILWAGDYFYLPLLCIFVLVKKKRWLNLGLITIGLSLISIESDPNPGKYLLWLSPLFMSGIIK